uniref:EOG090X08WB n=1 Tax=Daphnia lumholtzi TaxID=42856 RepID=A0A4Y7MGQ5_9CRUS|nr:EOG090X08WB [Daphnia lumholtzi]SVE78331.1 EOG090X08WB [Daphnia lumholtzi]SVE78959.1 EOG090X08WB [Daphnia lumholtzi]
MASHRETDTSLWLHNKLGISTDSWAGGSICSQLNPEVLKNIQECFVELQTQVKLKFLLSFFQFSRRNLEEWKTELEEILEVAVVDGDPWVAMVAEILKTYPATGALNMEIGSATDEYTRKIFNDLANDLRKLVKKHGETGMLPLECPYLNKTALFTVVGQQSHPVKHFTLKRKPKSAALRAELLQKSTDAQNNLKKNPAPTVPLRSRGIPRKMTDTTPLKGIPSRHIGGFASPLSRAGSTPTSVGALGSSPSAGPNRPSPRTLAGRKDGGIKLLDITEQPIGFAQAKKRKRQQELEAAQKAATESQATPSNPSQPLSGEESETGSVTETPEKVTPTPDYAAGLLPSNPPSTPAAPATPLASTSIPLTPLKEPPRMAAVRPPAAPSISSLPSGSLASPAQVVRLVTSQPPAPPSAATTVPTVYRLVQPAAAVAGQPTAATTATNQPVAPPKKSVALMLTREQMQEAQEMFKNANKVTRPEKALILGFMAGSRENPCPHLGNIVTIKLSEDEEVVTAGDGITTTRIVETHFQMNYAAGEWKRIKKMRKMEDTPTSVATVLATATG